MKRGLVVGLVAVIAAMGASGAQAAAAPVLTVAQAKHRIKAFEPGSTDPIVRCIRLSAWRVACEVLAYQPVTAQVINAETGTVEGEETTRGVPVPLWADVETGARIRWSFELPRRS